MQHVRDPSFVRVSTYALRQEFSDLAASPNDAVLLVKHFRSGAQLAQRPLLVFPEVFVQRLNFADLKPLPRNTLSAREISEFSKTARIVQQPPWLLSGAASYLKSIVENNQKRTWPSPPQVEFVSDGPRPFIESLPPPPDWMNFAPLPPRVVQVNHAKAGAIHGNPKGKAKAKAPTKATCKANSSAEPKAKGKAKANAKATGKAPAKAASELQAPAGNGGALNGSGQPLRAEGARQTGCNKCRCSTPTPNNMHVIIRRGGPVVTSHLDTTCIQSRAP